MAVAIVVGTTEQIEKGLGQRALTTTEASARLGVSVKTLYALIGTAQLTPYDETLGSYTLFLEADVERIRVSRLKRRY